MKFKYMMRGLGIGVIITAAVMGAWNRQAVADARVAVLKEYGLGEDKVLVEESETSSQDLSEESSAEETTEQVILRDEEKESEIKSVLDAAKESEQQLSTADPTQEFTDSEPSGSEPEGSELSGTESSIQDDSDLGDTIDIVISPGDDSGTVSRKLYNAGLIENASEYDAFLMQHGYDKKLATGTKTIGASDDWQEIAEKITRK